MLIDTKGDLCKTPDLSTVQSNSIAERADNMEIFSSVREARCKEMCQRWGFCKGLKEDDAHTVYHFRLP